MLQLYAEICQICIMSRVYVEMCRVWQVRVSVEKCKVWQVSVYKEMWFACRRGLRRKTRHWLATSSCWSRHAQSSQRCSVVIATSCKQCSSSCIRRMKQRSRSTGWPSRSRWANQTILLSPMNRWLPAALLFVLFWFFNLWCYFRHDCFAGNFFSTSFNAKTLQWLDVISISCLLSCQAEYLYFVGLLYQQNLVICSLYS